MQTVRIYCVYWYIRLKRSFPTIFTTYLNSYVMQYTTYPCGFLIVHLLPMHIMINTAWEKWSIECLKLLDVWIKKRIKTLHSIWFQFHIFLAAEMLALHNKYVSRHRLFLSLVTMDDLHCQSGCYLSQVYTFIINKVLTCSSFIQATMLNNFPAKQLIPQSF